MKRTRPGPLIAIGVIGAVAAFFGQSLLVATGGTRFEPRYELPFTLFVISVLIVVLAVPVWRASHHRSGRRIDPFYATRVVLLAKATSLCGGLFTGAAVGLLAFLLSRTVTAVSSIPMALVALGGAIVLLVAGLVAEHLCTVPPDDDDEQGGPGDGAVA